MGQVAITMNGRTYRLECNEGEEPHLTELAEYIGGHVEQMRQNFGQVGDDRLILMASLVVADELWALRTEAEALRAQLAEAQRDRSDADQTARSVETQLYAKIDAAAARIEGLNARILGSAGEAQ